MLNLWNRSRVARAIIGIGAAATAIAPAAHAQCLEGCTAIHTLVGEAAGDQFGWVSDAVGDLNGDGVQEFVLTAPTRDGFGADAGRIYVYDGATGAELFRATGPGGGAWLGHDATGAGDVNGDGVPDVIAGAPDLANGGTGRVIIYSGASAGAGVALHTFFGAAAGDQFGLVVTGDGDFNGDDVSDVAVGAPGSDAAGVDSGRVYIYSGADFSLICTLDGFGAGHNFGGGVSFVGDLDGDGRDEITIGANNAPPGAIGQAYVFRFDGASCVLMHTLNPEPPAIDFGQWFINAGDVDGDGVNDIYLSDFQLNKAYVFSGATGLRIRLLTGMGIGQFGIGRIVDDVNGDNHADLILAAWIQGTGGVQAGKAFVYSGADSTVLETFTHNVPFAGFGFDANGMGDVNGDGKDDYLITAGLDSSATGRAYVIAGTIGPPCPGDLNGDGMVSGTDLAILLGAWGLPGDADLSGDGVVGSSDLALLVGSWGPCL